MNKFSTVIRCLFGLALQCRAVKIVLCRDYTPWLTPVLKCWHQATAEAVVALHQTLLTYCKIKWQHELRLKIKKVDTHIEKMINLPHSVHCTLFCVMHLMMQGLFHVVQTHFMPYSLKKAAFIAFCHSSISNDSRMQGMLLQQCCFSPHNENWFPLSNKMSCLHFWATTQLAKSQRKSQTQGTGCSFFKSEEQV